MAGTSIGTSARDVFESAKEYAGGLAHPTIRLGVTGLSRSGKTVFITSLVHNLISGGRLPFFTPLSEGRILGAYLEPQPDDHIPRFDYEGHLAALTSEPGAWPKSTSRISQLRLTIEYEPVGMWRRVTGRRLLHLDIVDYPGEWLLDLSLLGKSFETWSRESLALARAQEPSASSRAWLSFIDGLKPIGALDEGEIIEGAKLFRDYLVEARSETQAYSTLPPGRLLMPGDLEGSPMLTFFPLELSEEEGTAHSIYGGELKRRYNAYLANVVKPFYRDHFARLDRQVVLVDALGALNAGSHALNDLEGALTSVLGSFNQGKNSFLSSVFKPRIDRILFAATKADHVHHSDHEYLEGLLRALTERASKRAKYSGAEVKVMAIAALRATEEAMIEEGGNALPALVGVPLKGQHIGSQVFDGTEQAAIFPGDLPRDPALAISHGRAEAGSELAADMRFISFRPPRFGSGAGKGSRAAPHIRMDHALDFLIGDRF